MQPHREHRGCVWLLYMEIGGLGSSAVDKFFGGELLRKLQLKQEAEVNPQEFHQIQYDNFIDLVSSDKEMCLLCFLQ